MALLQLRLLLPQVQPEPGARVRGHRCRGDHTRARLHGGCRNRLSALSSFLLHAAQSESPEYCQDAARDPQNAQHPGHGQGSQEGVEEQDQAKQDAQNAQDASAPATARGMPGSGLPGPGTSQKKLR